MSVVEEKAAKKLKNPYARREPNSDLSIALSPPEKDDTEKKLERLLFGDDDGFYDALKKHQGLLAFEGAVVRAREDSDADNGIDAGDRGEEGDGDVDMERVADDDLFFLDTGNAEVSDALVHLAEPTTMDSKENDDDEGLSRDEFGNVIPPPAWEDSDDNQLTISLARDSRLRKLRNTETEDLIDGREYIRRLRRQFLQLHPTPAWADPGQNLQRRKKARKVNSDESDDDSNTDEIGPDGNEVSAQPLAKLLQSAGDIIQRPNDSKRVGKRRLRQEMIEIHRLKDVGVDQPSSIDSLSFHPHYPLLLSSGPASTLWLHHVSPNAPAPNPLLTALHIKRTPIYTSAFTPPTGNRIFVAGRRRYFHIWDLDSGKVEKVTGSAVRKEEQKSMERFKISPCGRYVGLVGTSRKGGGLINVLDANTTQWIAQVRVDGRGGVADFAWWSNGDGMVIASKNGEMTEWDGRLRRVIARWIDEGAVGLTVVSMGGSSGYAQLGGDRWIAVGSSSGIVNVYDRRPWAAGIATAEKANEDIESAISRNPKPVRALDQLTTPVSHLVFSADSQILVIASRWKRDALRLIHLPSCTVYRNWPSANTPFGRISAVAISPESDILAVANEQGRIRMWQING